MTSKSRSTNQTGLWSVPALDQSDYRVLRGGTLDFRVYFRIVYTLAIVYVNFQRNLRTFVTTRWVGGLGEARENLGVYISIVDTLNIECANFQRNLRTFVFWGPPAGFGGWVVVVWEWRFCVTFVREGNLAIQGEGSRGSVRWVCKVCTRDLAEQSGSAVLRLTISAPSGLSLFPHIIPYRSTMKVVFPLHVLLLFSLLFGRLRAFQIYL